MNKKQSLRALRRQAEREKKAEKLRQVSRRNLNILHGFLCPDFII